MDEHAFRFDYWAASDTGCVRELNEDRYFVSKDNGVWLVADGMGGHDAGEIASASIVEHADSIGSPISARDLLARFQDRIAKANSEIRSIADERKSGVIGATLASLLTYDRHYACVWSGDSRVYLVRKGKLKQISKDHTEVQELFDRGLITEEEAEHWPRKNVITRAIGVTEEPQLDLEQGTIESGDTFVICSDGLTAHVDDHEVLEAIDGRHPKVGCDMLMDMTLTRGGTDNVTIVVVKCHKASGTATIGLGKD